MTAVLPDVSPVPLTRRQVLSGGLAMLFVVGCAPASPEGGAADTDGAYPREVGHYGGTTTIAARPQRIVLLTPYNELAALLSLGIAPTQYSYAAELPGYLQAELDRLGATPTALPGTDFVANLESVAAAGPDVIIGDPDGVELSGPRLAEIAPLVVVPGTGRGGWRPNLRIVGDVFDLRERADTAIADTDARLAALAGLDFGAVRTAAVLVPSPGEGVVYLLNDPTNQTVELLGTAGLGSSPEVDAAPDTLSLERLDVLDSADGIVVRGDGPEIRAFLAQPVFQAVPAIRDGRAHFIPDGDRRSAVDVFAPVALGVVETVIREIAATFAT